MWAVKKDRKYEKDGNGSLQHGVFPEGHPTNCEPRPTGLNFCNQIRAGVYRGRGWPSKVKSQNQKSLFKVKSQNQISLIDF